MFICAICQEKSRPRETPVQKIVETREKVYSPRRHANPGKVDGDDPGGKGWEIVKVILTHAVCPPPQVKGAHTLAESYRRIMAPRG